jgi:hypothetical protein
MRRAIGPADKIHRRVAIGALLLAAVVVTWGLPVRAQSCSADVQCPNQGQPRTECIGDMLVVRRSVCAGICRYQDLRREVCNQVNIGGTCAGGYFETMTGRCSIALGACERRMERQPCLASCSCRNNVLIVSTGACSPAIGCHRAVKRCRGGCSCDPEPRCNGERQ